MTKTLRIEFKFTKDDWALLSGIHSERAIRHLLITGALSSLWMPLLRNRRVTITGNYERKPQDLKKTAAGEKSLTLRHRRRNR